jgi:pimeloyl-ACP methyl ester carboxylesterase
LRVREGLPGPGPRGHRCNLLLPQMLKIHSPLPPAKRSTGLASQRARRELLTVLQKQFERDTAPWIMDLVSPFLQGPPQPLIGTRRSRELADVDSQFISLDGLDIHYKEHRDERSPPSPNVLCLHGFQGSTFSYRKVISKLAGPRVLAYDRPPFGLSSRPRSSPGNNPYSLSSAANLCSSLIKALNLDQGQGVVLVGHSAGCPVAIQAASLLGPALKGLVLIAPAVDASDPKKNEGFLSRLDAGQLLRFALIRAITSDQTLGVNYIRRSLLKRKEEVQNGKLDLYFDDTDETLKREAIEGYLRPLEADDWDVGSLELLRSFNLSSSTLDFSVPCPVLIIQGANDATISPSAARVVAEKFKTHGCVTRFEELKECGHVPMEERDREVIELINEFILKNP